MGFSVEAQDSILNPRVSMFYSHPMVDLVCAAGRRYARRTLLTLPLPEGKQPDFFELIFPYVYKSFARANGSLTLIQLLDASDGDPIAHG